LGRASGHRVTKGRGILEIRLPLPLRADIHRNYYERRKKSVGAGLDGRQKKSGGGRRAELRRRNTTGISPKDARQKIFEEIEVSLRSSL